MIDFTSTIVAALIGSILGSVGAVFADHVLTARSERSHRRDMLVQRYLFQLQDALEMLYYRLHNLAFRGGRFVMDDDYFEKTTLYALGRVLAMERIFMLEAVYPQIDSIYPGLGKFLKIHLIYRQLDGGFFQFDRLSLAEAIIVHEGDSFRIATFLEFRKQYEAKDSEEKTWLEPASEAIQSFDHAQMEELLKTILETASHIAEKTDINSSIVPKQSRKKLEASLMK